MAKQKKPRQATTTPTAIHRAFREIWMPEFFSRFPDELFGALQDFAEAYEEPRPWTPQDLLDAAKPGGSLPMFWAIFWRPMADGKTGIDYARQSGLLQAPVLKAAVERLAQARCTLIELISLTPDQNRMIVRDLFSGELRRVVSTKSLVGSYVRWRRSLTWLVDLGTGVWDLPTIFLASPATAGLTPADLVQHARKSLEDAGIDPAEIDPADPFPGLRKWAGFVLAPFIGNLVTAEIEPPVRRQIYAQTSDGDRYEVVSVRLRVPSEVDLAAALERAPGIAREAENRWSWLTPLDPALPPGSREILATFTHKPTGWELTAGSPQRLARALTLVETLTGHRPKVAEELDRIQPWVEREGFVDSPGPGVESVTSYVFEETTLYSDLPPGERERALFLDDIRRSVHREISPLGGRPIDLVKTPEGRARVEAWLRQAETRGLPGEDEQADRYIDLDPLRAELGLPTVESQVHELLATWPE